MEVSINSLSSIEKDMCDYMNSSLFVDTEIDDSVSITISSDENTSINTNININENIYLFNHEKLISIGKNWKEYITSLMSSDSKNVSDNLSIENELSYKVNIKRNREWNDSYKYKIIGAKTIYYISEFLIPSTKYIIYCKNINEKKIEITLGVNILHIKYVTQFKNITMIPNKNIFIDIQILYSINNLSFNPYSELINNIIIFNKTVKHKDTRPVWIYGGSYTKGINYFRKYIKSFSIDENKILPDIIACDTIIMSNILPVTLNNIKNRCIGNNEYIFVGFEQIKITNKITNKNKNKNNFFLSKINLCKHVYIFTGDKNIGKRHIAHRLNTDNIYETKFSYVLPNEMKYDIVIISPNSEFTYLDIIDKYDGNYIFISVHFSKV